MDEALEKQAESFLRSHPGLRDFEYVVLLAFSPSVFDILQPNISGIYLSTILVRYYPVFPSVSS